LASIQQQAQRLEQSQANNFIRWPILGIEVWPNPQAAGSYDAEVAYLTNWLTLRIGYLDSLFNSRSQTQTTFKAADLVGGEAVTLVAHITGGTSPTGIVTFLSNGILLGVGTLNNGAATLTSNLPPGTNNLEAVYNGDQDNALSTSSTQAVVVAPVSGSPFSPPNPRK
jgi:hypothetical protein